MAPDAAFVALRWRASSAAASRAVDGLPRFSMAIWEGCGLLQVANNRLECHTVSNSAPQVVASRPEGGWPMVHRWWGPA